MRDEVATGLGLAKSHVRVIKEYMGGGFGGKNNAGANTFVAALFAQRTGRPVRCVLEREDEQSDGGHRAPSRQVVTIGAMRDGRLVAIDVTTEIPLGASGWEGSVAAIYGEMYACENVRTHETFAWAHTQPMMAFRAPGHVEGAFGLERTMDVLARAIGMDPLGVAAGELRRAGRGAAAAVLGESVAGVLCGGGAAVWVGGGAGAARGWGWEWNGDGGGRGWGEIGFGGDPGATASVSRNVRRGVGMAACVWGAGGGPPAYATVRLNSDATIDVLSGTQDLGTGSRTVLAQIAAESLGARLGRRARRARRHRTHPLRGELVGLHDHRLGRTGGAAGGRTGAAAPARGGEPAPRVPCGRPRRPRLDDRHPRRRPATRLRRRHAQARERDDHGSGEPRPQSRRTSALMSFGVQFAEVEVDVETGVVRVLRITAAHDVGRVINPLLAGSQMEGAILQGLGYALFEERLLDARPGGR